MNGCTIFHNDFSESEGYGICLHIVYRHSCDFLYGDLGTGRAKPFGSCAEIIQKPCDASAVAMQSSKVPYGTREGSIQRLRRDGAVTVSGLYGQCTICFPK